MKTIAILTAVAGLALAAGPSAFASQDAAPAAKPASPQRSCFFASQVNGWSSDRGSDDVVYLNVGVKDVYRAELFGTCPDVDFAQRIGIQTRGGGTSICDGLDVDLLVHSSIGPQRCPVTKLTKLTPDEVAARKASSKKKK